MSYRDPELPNGFQDADFEQAALERAGARESRLWKQGICAHGWTQPNSPSAFATGKPYKIVCNHCGALFDDSAAHMAARANALNGE